MNLIDRRQFIIAKTAYKNERFRTVQLNHGFILSYDIDLNVQIGKIGVLLGNAFSCTQEGIDLDSQEIEKSRLTWAGRWILITENSLYLDATGSMGCYIYNKDGEVILSSSLHLLQSCTKASWIANYQIQYNDGLPYMDYYPIPYTPFEGITKILPSQYYCFQNNRAEYYQIDESYEIFRKFDIEELYSRFEYYLNNIFIAIKHKYDNNIWIPLTAGVDSRTNVALAVHNKMSFGAFTIKRENSEKWDLLAPKIICGKIRCKHIYYDDRDASNRKRESDFDQHCGNNGGQVTVGTCRKQYIKGIDVPNAKHAVVLWGTAWERYGRNFWGMIPLCDTTEERFNEWAAQSNEILKSSNIHTMSIEKWLNEIEKHPLNPMDWRQRMYYDQRMGSWLSGLFQAYDLFDSTWIAPVNCGYVFGVLMNLVDKTFAAESRSDKRYQIMLINEYIPQVGKIPFDRDDYLLYKVYKKLSRVIQLKPRKTQR